MLHSVKKNYKKPISKLWLSVWNRQGRNLKQNKIENIIKANGHNSVTGQFNKKNWFKYIKSMIRYVKFSKNFKILEYGCGSGVFLNFWYKKNYTLYGIDYSNSLIRKCKEFYPKINVKKGEILSIKKFKTKFDLIFSHSVFQYFDNLLYAKSLILEMLSALNSNGYICILDVPDEKKKKKYYKKIKTELGAIKFEKKYGKHKHIFYNKSFFKKLAIENNLQIKIFNHNHKYNENSIYRYNVIFKKKLINQ